MLELKLMTITSDMKLDYDNELQSFWMQTVIIHEISVIVNLFSL